MQENFKASVPRIRLWDRNNPAEVMKDGDFIRDHGLSKFAFCRILAMTRGQLNPTQDHRVTIPAAQQLSCFLRFLRSGSFLRCVEGTKDIQLSQSIANQQGTMT